MKLEVIIGTEESSKGRLFENIKEAAFYMHYNELQASLLLQDKLGVKIESQPKYENEIKRIVYKNELGEKRYYILKITN